MVSSAPEPSRSFSIVLSIVPAVALMILAGCSAGPNARPVTAESPASAPQEAAAEIASSEATEHALPVTRVSEEPEVYALPGAKRLPPVPPRWMTPLALSVKVFEPPAAYHPDTRPQALGYFAAEIPTVKGSSFVGVGARPASADPASSAHAAFSPAVAPAAPSLSTSFASTDFDDNATNTGGYVFIPPDSSAAAGPNDVLNVVNVTLRVHDKTGTLLADTALDDFFSALSPDTFTFDPKVIFDQYAGRWLVVTLERLDDGAGGATEQSRIFLAVSDDADPLGTWYQVAINAKTTISSIPRWADYPGFAVDDQAVYVTANMFSFSANGGGYGGVRLWVVDKGLGSGGFYDGGSVSVSKLDPYAGGGVATTTQPAHMYGDAPAGVGTFLVSYSGMTNGSTEAVQVVRLDDPLGSPTFTQASVDFGDKEDFPGALPGAPQSGSSALIDTNDRRALDAVWYDDSLWLTSTIDPKSGDPDSGEATAYWWEIDTSNLASLTIADQGVVLGEDIATNTSTFFPSIAVNGVGQVAIGFSGSASSIYAGSYYTTRDPGDAAGTTSGSATLASGAASYERTFCGSNRWGDYSGTAVDPVDGCFWVYNERAMSTGSTISLDCDGNGSKETVESGRWETTYGKLCPSGACPADMVLASVDLSGTQTRKAAVSLRTVEGVTVKTGADVTFRAGTRVVLGSGFKVESGASFVAEIAGSPCS